jgi:hypothetical protein
MSVLLSRATLSVPALAACLLVFAAACADSTEAPTTRPTAPADWPTYTDPDGRFSLRYPDDWYSSGGEIYSFDPSTATGSPGTYPSGTEIETHVFESAGRGFCGGALKLDASGALVSIDAEATATTLGGQPAWEIVREDPDPPTARIHGISLVHEGYCITLVAYYTQETPDDQTFAQIADSFEILF